MIKTIARASKLLQLPDTVAEANVFQLPTRGYPPFRPVTLPAPLVKIFRAPEQPKSVPLPKLPPPKTYSAQRSGGWVSRIAGHNLIDGQRIEIELPINTPRFTNGATLKIMLGARKSDLLLRLEDHGWVICEDDTRIDLLDRSVQFKVGVVAVFS